jgi:hypothetical protein
LERGAKNTWIAAMVDTNANLRNRIRGFYLSSPEDIKLADQKAKLIEHNKRLQHKINAVSHKIDMLSYD